MDEFSLRKLATVYTTDIRVRFYATFMPTLPYASRRQRHKCRLSARWTDAARPFNGRRNIRLSSGTQHRPTCELSWLRSSESPAAFSLLAAYPPPVRRIPYGTINCNFENSMYFYKLKLKTQINSLVFWIKLCFIIMAIWIRKNKLLSKCFLTC